MTLSGLACDSLTIPSVVYFTVMNRGRRKKHEDKEFLEADTPERDVVCPVGNTALQWS